MKSLTLKNSLVTALLLLVAVAILIRITPPYVPQVIELQIHKNDGIVRHIDQDRDIAYSSTVWVDRLDLFERNQLRHPKLGQIGFGEHFFVDLSHEFEVKQAGQYRFVVGSDDGFIVRINGNELCRFSRDRAYVKQTCPPIRLSEGTHRFDLNYFQAGSGAGLTVEYMQVGDDRPYFFGDDSPFMRF